MDPGKIVHPIRWTQPDWAPNTARGNRRPLPVPGRKHQFSQAAGRCVGVGQECRATNPGDAPNYPRHKRRRCTPPPAAPAAVRDGRRRRDHRWVALHRGARGRSICATACKGCLSDCPVNVGMAAYKAEFLSTTTAGACARRLYATRWDGFPLWSRLATHDARHRQRADRHPEASHGHSKPSAASTSTGVAPLRRAAVSPDGSTDVLAPQACAARRRAAVARYLHQLFQTRLSPTTPSPCSDRPASGAVVPRQQHRLLRPWR